MKRKVPNSLPMLWLPAVVFLLGTALSFSLARAEPNLVTAIQDVAKKAIPGVVHVEVTEKQQISNPLLPFQNDPFFEYFFGNRKMPKKFEREVVGIGSGILLDAQGHILTNSHVVSGATKMIVILSDGRRFSEKEVKVLGSDSKTDLAVIQISDGKENLPYLTFGDSDKIDVGQWVVAIGHPQGFDQTVTQGIISAKHRRGISDPSSYQDFLQTDAAINPGNSGGPLLNLNSEVIGVNAAIVSGSGGFEGIGLAIPSNLALQVAKQLMASGKVERGWLGITIQNVTPELARSFGLSGTKGVLVANVLKDSPAEAAGIKQGDVIVEYQGKAVEDSDSFRNEVASAPVGQNVTLAVMREGKRQDIGIRVASDQEYEKTLLASVGVRFGVEVRAPAEKEISRYDLESGKGVVIARVTPKGPFAKAGIEVGDIILQINEHNLEGTEDFGSLLSTAPSKKKVILTVLDHRSRKIGMIRITAP